jgi:hypothetical protein
MRREEKWKEEWKGREIQKMTKKKKLNSSWNLWVELELNSDDKQNR